MVCTEIHNSVKYIREALVETTLMANETVAEEYKKQDDLPLTGLSGVSAVQTCSSPAPNESPGGLDAARHIATPFVNTIFCFR